MELTKKKLEPTKRVCFRLKEARLHKGLTIETVADRLKMNKEHIVSIEQCEFEQLPFAPIYQKKLLGNYAEMLGIPKNTIMKQFELEEDKKEQLSIRPLSKKRHDWWYNLPFFFRIGAISLFTISLLGYLGFQVKQIVKPPSLEVVSPVDGVIAKTDTIDVRGKTDKEVKIMINGKEVHHTEEGIFEEPVTLTDGVNTIVVSATTKHGQTTTITRYVVSQKEQQFSLTSQPKIHN